MNVRAQAPQYVLRRNLSPLHCTSSKIHDNEEYNSHDTRHPTLTRISSRLLRIQANLSSFQSRRARSNQSIAAYSTQKGQSITISRKRENRERSGGALYVGLYVNHPPYRINEKQAVPPIGSTASGHYANQAHRRLNKKKFSSRRALLWSTASTNHHTTRTKTKKFPPWRKSAQN